MKPIPNEQKLMKEFNNRSPEAYRILFDKFYLHLTYFANRVTGDIEESKDIVSNVFINIFESERKFEKETNLKAFLFIAVKSKCIKSITTLRYQEKKNLFSIYGEDANDADIEEKIIAEEVRTRVLHEIYEAIESLPPKRKEIFKMSYIQGMTAAEIANKLNIDKSAIHVSNSKARKEIRERAAFVLLIIIYLLRN